MRNGRKKHETPCSDVRFHREPRIPKTVEPKSTLSGTLGIVRLISQSPGMVEDASPAQTSQDMDRRKFQCTKDKRMSHFLLVCKNIGSLYRVTPAAPPPGPALMRMKFLLLPPGGRVVRD